MRNDLLAALGLLAAFLMAAGAIAAAAVTRRNWLRALSDADALPIGELRLTCLQAHDEIIVAGVEKVRHVVMVAERDGVAKATVMLHVRGGAALYAGGSYWLRLYPAKVNPLRAALELGRQSQP